MKTSERDSRLRQWRRAWQAWLMFAIGLVLLASCWLQLLPALWWSDIDRYDAFLWTVWFLAAQVFAISLLWGWLSRSWRGDSER